MRFLNLLNKRKMLLISISIVIICAIISIVDLPRKWAENDLKKLEPYKEAEFFVKTNAEISDNLGGFLSIGENARGIISSDSAIVSFDISGSKRTTRIYCSLSFKQRKWSVRDYYFKDN